MILHYTVIEIWHVTDIIIFHFGLFFALLPLNFYTDFYTVNGECLSTKKQ